MGLGCRATMSSKPSMVRRAVEGDAAALDRLAEEYRSVVWRFARHLDRRADEESVNAILLKVLELLRDPKREFDTQFGEKFTAWLYSVSNHVLQSERRGRAKAARVLSLDHTDPSDDRERRRIPEPAGRGMSPSKAALRVEMQKLVRNRMEALPPLYREVVRLHWVEGRSVDEIAKRLKVPGTTVRKRLQRGHDRMRTLLKGVKTTLVRNAHLQSKKG